MSVARLAGGGLARGLVLGLVHLLLVSSLGAKLLYDRSTRPRVWAETTPYDPDLPIRGRYVSLMVRVDAPDIAPPADDKPDWGNRPVALGVENDRLVARLDGSPGDGSRPAVTFRNTGDGWRTTLRDPVAFFIPEKVADPSRRPAGETLWVEVTVPRKGPPRPIRLGVRRGDGPIEPLPLD